VFYGNFSSFINKVKYGHGRVAIYHPGAGKPHHRPYFLSHPRLVTMNLALTADCFTFLERTGIKTRHSVFV
jgi:hypothetical protein